MKNIPKHIVNINYQIWPVSYIDKNKVIVIIKHNYIWKMQFDEISKDYW